MGFESESSIYFVRRTFRESGPLQLPTPQRLEAFSEKLIGGPNEWLLDSVLIEREADDGQDAVDHQSGELTAGYL